MVGFNWDLFNQTGWGVFGKEVCIFNWASQARKNVWERLLLKDFENDQLRCGGTWFVGTNFLNNDKFGGLGKVTFKGQSVQAITQRYGSMFQTWDQAQISICFKGYPQPMAGESHTSFKYRKNRFNAHVDGILPVGLIKRRYAREYHAFILGIPLVNYNKFAAPVVVWEGSHKIMHDCLSKQLIELDTGLWKSEDITGIYNEARREIFLKCKPQIVTVPVGGSYLIHRLALHGVMPWAENGKSGDGGRMIAYFRPQFSQAKFWLNRMA